MSTPRRLLARLRDLMARGTAPMPELVRLVAAELVTEVCSIYVMRPGEVLELAATEGLRAEAIGTTRLRVGEGIVGLAAATQLPQNLADAQNHPAFAWRPETGEDLYASMLAVPVRRAGRTLGVLAVQNRTPRNYDADEVEVVETVAMLLAELLAAHVAEAGEQALVDTLPRRFSAVPLAPGVAIGPILVNGPAAAPRRLLAEDPAQELARLDAAVVRMQQGIDDLIAAGLPDAATTKPDAVASREILDAYKLVAADSGWLKRVADAVRGGLSAEAAVHRIAADLRDRMRRVTDPYLRERLADIEDMVGRLLAALDGGEAGPVPPGAILIARRLGPAELLAWHARGIAGVVIEEATPSGHAAILARALGLPALAAPRGTLEAAESDDEAVLDADEGQLILRPEQDVVRHYRRAQEARHARAANWAALRDRPTATADGTPVALMLNVGLALELTQLDATGAAGIGLFRTEIAMLARGAIADTAEQAAVYARVLDAAGPRPVLFRTLDLGGDKLLPGSAPTEENPAMGWRSLRVGLDRPALLRRQLRALLLAAGGRDLSVMFPMVATVAEFRAARALLRAEAARVRPAPARLSIGTMLEIPALMWQLDALLPEVDFISVGTNDLLQFLFAADRGTPGLAARYDLLSAPVLDLLAQLVEACGRAGVPLSVCGEHAGRPLEALAMVGLGITSLSMPASGVLPVKAALAALDLPALRNLLIALRRTRDGAASLREPIAAWAREHGLPV
ncbi:MAG: GAF domain-containing protein [Alphaproteobacteria bacterium]|nr:GAF domain-containing protein [Alphaproteobacteria bacterium]